MPKYTRTKDGITTSNKATHELIEDIVDAGYYKTLHKGSLIRIGRTWDNFYGRWTSILDINGNHYDIPFDKVENVIKELKQTDTIEELCDYALYRNFENRLVVRELPLSTSWESVARDMKNGLLKDVKLAILTDKGLIYVAKMKGILPNGEID